MHKVIAQAAQFTYYKLEDGMPNEELVVTNYLNPTLVDLSIIDNVRIVALRGPSVRGRGSQVAFYSFWWDGTDLNVLDRKVEENNYQDDDFVRSVNTMYQNTFCVYCRKRFHTLVIPTGDGYYLGAPDLHFQKIKLYAKEARIFDCPNCGRSLRQLVVKIFGPDEESPLLSWGWK